MSDEEVKSELIELRQLLDDIHNGNTIIRFVDWDGAISLLTNVIEDLKARIVVGVDVAAR